MYADNDEQETLTFQALKESGEENLWAQGLQVFCLPAQTHREPHHVLSSLAVGRPFGPGVFLLEVTPEASSWFSLS